MWLARRAALRGRIDVRRGDMPYKHVVVEPALTASTVVPVDNATPSVYPRSAEEPL